MTRVEQIEAMQRKLERHLKQIDEFAKKNHETRYWARGGTITVAPEVMLALDRVENVYAPVRDVIAKTLEDLERFRTTLDETIYSEL